MPPERSPFTYCGTYVRHQDDGWCYPWGEPVPHATDLRLSHLLALSVLDGEEVSRVAGRATDELRQMLDRDRAVTSESAAMIVAQAEAASRGHDIVVGMLAPELQATAMLTLPDIAELIDVAPSTVQAYRRRGYLPDEQLTLGRTPLWSRAIIRRWRDRRPGRGWRTDIYGTDGPVVPARGNGRADVRT